MLQRTNVSGGWLRFQLREQTLYPGKLLGKAPGIGFEILGAHPVGDFVEVAGFKDEDGVPVATRLERDDPETESELRGFVQSVAQPDLVILGVTVRTDSNTEFEDENDNDIDAATFFSTAAGRFAKARGTWDGTVLLADEVEFENEVGF